VATAASNSVSLPPVNGSNGSQTDEFINGLVQGGSWQFGNEPRNITYSFNLNFDLDTAGNFIPGRGGNWTGAFVNAVNLALEAWSNVANISFVNITSGTYFPESKADMAFALTGNELLASGGVVGLGFFPDPAFANVIRDVAGADFIDYPNPEGDVFLDNFTQYFRQLFQPLVPGTIGFQLILHEIGHALGLKHPDDDGSNGRPTFAQLGISAYDARDWTVMNQFDVFSNSLNSLNNVATPMPLDILAMQQIYGANTAYHSGNDVYPIRDISPTLGLVNAIPHTTIWDAGGIDTIIAEGTSIVANLNPGGSISTNGRVAATYIAFGVTIENVIGSSSRDAITGNDAANFIDGGNDSDTLLGGAGDDTLRGGEGLDTLDGGTGADTADYSDATSAYSVSLVTQLAIRIEPFVDDTLTSIENLIGTSFGDSLTGDANNNVLDGGPGIDTLVGGNGNDTFVVGDAGDSIVESAGEGTDTVQSWIPWTLAANFENLTLLGSASYGVGNDANNVITGNSANNPLLRGGAGSDTIMGGAGNDWIEGETGNDPFPGVPGNDLLNGDDGNDTVLAGAGDDILNGGAGTDFLIGEAGDDLVYGGSEWDAIDGRQGSDVLYGEDGNDIIFGDGYFYLFGFANDSLFGGPGSDIMMGEAGESSLSGAGDAIYGEDGNDTLDGGAGDDAIYGGNGNDVIDGDHGNDTIVGGQGADILLGSNAVAFGGPTVGSDLFVYQLLADGGDSIYGFDMRTNENDRIDLRPLFDAIGYAGTAPRAGGFLYVFQNGANTDVYVDANGVTSGVNLALMTTLVGVTASTLTDSFFLFQ
jgi:serralysin